jgi:hypothetical protein
VLSSKSSSSQRSSGQSAGTIKRRDSSSRSLVFFHSPSFVDICMLTYYYLQYNKSMNNLLGYADFDEKKHEIKHDTRVINTTILPLGPVLQVQILISVA